MNTINENACDWERNSSQFKQVLEAVLKDTYWYEHLGQFGTHYFWVANHNKYSAIFAKTLDEFNEKVYEAIEQFIICGELKKLKKKGRK